MYFHYIIRKGDDGGSIKFLLIFYLLCSFLYEFNKFAFCVCVLQALLVVCRFLVFVITFIARLIQTRNVCTKIYVLSNVQQFNLAFTTIKLECFTVFLNLPLEDMF